MASNPKPDDADMVSNPEPDVVMAPNLELYVVMAPILEPDAAMAPNPELYVVMAPNQEPDAATNPEPDAAVAPNPELGVDEEASNPPKGKRDRQGRKRSCCVPGCIPSGFVHHKIPASASRRAQWLVYV